MYFPVNIPATEQTYDLMISDESNIVSYQSDFGGEITSSSSITCPFEAYFADSDVIGSSIVKPSIFASDFMEYSSPFYIS